MNYFDPNGDSISVFDVCEAYQLLEVYYNVGGWVRERPSNQRRMESIGCQLSRIGYSDLYRDVDLWASPEEVAEEIEQSSDDENVRFVYFKKVLEWNLPIEDDDRAVIDRIFTIDAIERWCPTYYPTPPWRAVLVVDPDKDFLGSLTCVLERPVDGGRQTYRDALGKAIEFNSYEEATAAALRLTEELTLDPSNKGS